jgi:hypothetical protein
MITQAARRIDYLCEILPPLISAIREEEFAHKSAPSAWSKKEILGHLVDSAANNHQRFIRAQFEDTPLICYDQEKWNLFSFHNKINSEELILLWKVYNKHLASLIRLIPEKNLQRQCDTGKDAPVGLQYLITDYVDHMEHHLKQIVEYR